MSLEQELRRVLADDRHALPAWPDATERVGAGVRRRRRRRYAAIGSAIAVAVILASVPAALGLRAKPDRAPIGTPSDTVIPWIDTPADPPGEPARRGPRPGARPCTAADLAGLAWFEPGGAAGGHVANVALLPNNSGSRCTLAGSAKVIATDAATGRRAELATRSGTYFDGGIKQYPATIDPGEAARVDIATASGCNGGINMTHYRDVVLVVLGRPFPLSGLDLHTTCQVSIGSWYVLPPVVNAPLTVTLDTPPHAHRGQSYQYTVTMINVTRPLHLYPCPVYTQTLANHVSTYRLNCAIGSIPVDRPVRFAMTLHVPRDAPLGTTQLTWTAVMADGTVAIADQATGGAAVQVVG